MENRWQKKLQNLCWLICKERQSSFVAIKGFKNLDYWWAMPTLLRGFRLVAWT